jgi:monofunctional glycosyltransferase
MFHRQVMTSLKGPFSEHGDTSPDLDVLTGPPAEEAAVAAEVARAAPEPAQEPPPEPAPGAEDAPDEQPPAETRTLSAAPDGPDDAPSRHPLVEPPAAPAETPEIADQIAAATAIAEEIPAETAQPESAAEENLPKADVVAPSALAAVPGPAETVEPEAVHPGIDIVEIPADAAALAIVEPASAPAGETPPPLPEILAPPTLAPIAVPAISSAITAPDSTTLEPPTQPAPALSPRTATPAAKPAGAPWRLWLRRAIFAFVGLAAGYAVLILLLIVLYRTVDPPRSTVMLGLNLAGQSVDYEPVPITSISSYLQRAVITSEDARFCRHRGVDWAALAEAMQDSRGGSTITMQVAKNLFLWPSRSYIRKAIEIPVALMIDFAWPKRRILEVYLNIAEWGPGVFGAEAAAQYHFGKSASRLTAHEATLLAASLPNPIAREAGDPGRVTALLASRLRARMANSDAYVTCLGLRPMPRAEPERAPKSGSVAPPKPAPKPSPWQTKTEPAKPAAPFNPWQN